MVLAVSIDPMACSRAVPAIATTIASSHIRIRRQSPNVTMSVIEPIVQKLTRYATAPKTNARANARPVTSAGSGRAALGMRNYLMAISDFERSARDHRCHCAESLTPFGVVRRLRLYVRSFGPGPGRSSMSASAGSKPQQNAPRARGGRWSTFAAIAALAVAFDSAAHGSTPSSVTVDVYDRTQGETLAIHPLDAQRYVVGTPGHVRLRRRDVEQCVGCLAAVGKVLQQLALRDDRRTIVAARVLRIANPVLRRRRERAARIRFDERRKAADRTLVVTAFEKIECGVVRALLGHAVGRIASRRRGGDNARRAGGAAWRRARRRQRACVRRARSRRRGGVGGSRVRRWRGRKRRRRLDLAQPRVKVDIQIALPLLRLLEFVRDHFDLPAQLREIALQQLHLRAEIGEPAAFRLLLEQGEPILELALHLRDPLVGRVDAPSRLFIVEQRGMGLAGKTLSLSALEDIGVRRVSVGSALARAAFGEFLRAAQEIRSKGTFGFANQAIPFAEINAMFRRPRAG